MKAPCVNLYMRIRVVEEARKEKDGYEYFQREYTFLTNENVVGFH